MIIKNQDKIAEISHLIPPNLNMFGVSDHQNDRVLKKDLWFAIKEDETNAWLYSDKSC